MKLSDLISTTQTHLDDALSVPVVAAPEQSGSTPSVEIEDWDTTPLDGTASNYAGTLRDEGGNAKAKVRRLPYDARLSLSIRGSDALDATQIHDELRREIVLLESDPNRLSSSITLIEGGGGGGVSYQVGTETTARATQALTVRTAHTVADVPDYETIEQITFDVGVTN